ncbi:MAG: class I SAM-dependent methyltransferase [Planctomycetota bacterium]
MSRGADWERGRQRALNLAREHVERGTPLAWFEALYAAADGKLAEVPWEDERPQPLLVEWLEREAPSGAGQRALVVGAGLDDDAEELARRGYRVTGFDVSPTAVDWARRRFPDSRVAYLAADLFALPVECTSAFDLVVEVYTLQALPPELRSRAMACLAATVAPGGRLVAVMRARDDEEAVDIDAVPWPLSPEELLALERGELELETLEDLFDDEDPPVRRLRATFRSL